MYTPGHSIDSAVPVPHAGVMSIATSTPLPILAFAVFATIAVAACDVNVSLDDDTTRRVEYETVPAGSLRVVDVDTGNGDVEVRGGAGDEIGIRSVLQERHEGDAEATISVDGDRLVIGGACDGHWWDDCSVGFVVTVPSGVDVAVSTDNGRVELDGIDGDVHVETDNGAIEATALGSDTVVTRTDNGRIGLTFDDAPRSVTTRTDNGAISVRLPEDTARYSVDAHSGNGAVDVDVHTDPDAEHQVAATSDNGSIGIGYRTA